MTEKKEKRIFSREFKEGAVRLVVEDGRKVSEVARDLDIGSNLLHRWKRQMREAGGEIFVGKGHLRPEDEEMRRMKRAYDDMKEERDILKKALAIFSKKPR
jgi:transposase